MKKDSSPRNSLSALVLYAVILLGYLWQYFSGWKLLTYWGIDVERNFSDFHLTWRQLVCGFREYPEATFDCVNLNSKYIYGNILAHISQFSFIDPVIDVFALISVVASFLILTYFLITYLPTPGLAKIIIVLILISPPVQLLVQRGNIDIHLTALLAVAVILINNGKIFFGFVFICVATLVKFYALPVVIFYSIKYTVERKRFWLAYLCSAFVVAVYCFLNYSSVMSSIPSPNWAAFGFRNTAYWLDFIIPGDLKFSQVILIILMTAIYFLARAKLFDSTFINLEESHTSILLVFGTLFLLVYFSGSNFDYRLIILDIVGIAIVGTPNLFARCQIYWVSILSLVLINYLSFNTNGYLQAFGDLLIAFWAVWLIALSPPLIRRLRAES
jgi:hypothetical protein